MEYIIKSKEKLKINFNQRRREGKNLFIDFEDFYDWYINQKKSCHYCSLDESEMQSIVMQGIVTSNRFPQNGIIGRGQARGVWLEVDRLQPKANYSRDNCVLSCYFCNNDKSDVFDGVEYKLFMEDRVGYLRRKLKENKPSNKT